MNKKNAFTIAEIIIVMAVIGILTVFGMATLSKYDKAIKYVYSNIYQTLDRALFNAMNYSGELKNPFVTTDYDDEGQNYDVSPEMGAERLCLMLADYINSSQISCSSNHLADDTGVNLGKVKIKTLNGVDIYISKRLQGSANNPAFFLVYADINGSEMPPNTLEYTPPSQSNHFKGVDPDIFAFAALENGRICPLGVPEVEPRFMTARVAYVSNAKGEGNAKNNNKGEDELITKFSSTSRPYYEVKTEAWGFYSNDSIDYTDPSYIIDEEAATYNDYIRSKLPKGNKIYKFMNGKQRFSAPAGISLRSQPINQHGFNCVENSAEECWVVVDKYVY